MPKAKREQPRHYAGDVDPIDLIQSHSMMVPFSIGNIIKYVLRAEKHQDPQESFFKALHYLVFLYASLFGKWDRDKIDSAYRCCRDAITTNLSLETRGNPK